MDSLVLTDKLSGKALTTDIITLGNMYYYIYIYIFYFSSDNYIVGLIDGTIYWVNLMDSIKGDLQ